MIEFKHIRYFIFFIFIFISDSIFSQNNENEKTGEKKEEVDLKKNEEGIKKNDVNQKMDEESFIVPPLLEKDLFLEGYLNRIQFRMGLGYSRISPFVLKEVSESWMINSFFKSSTDPDNQIAIPIDSPEYIPMYANHLAFAYSFRNRLSVELNRWETGAKFNRKDPTSVTFISPRTAKYYNSIYEGVRLLEYLTENISMRVEYLHPILPWLRIGGSISRVNFSEKNTFTFGSYTRTRNTATPPLVSTWSAGGDVNQIFRFRGNVPGITAKFYPAKWLEIQGRMELINWKGNFNLSGFQILQRTQGTISGSGSLLGLYSLYSGNVSEKGYLTQVEAIFYFCRYSINIGLIREDYKRKYTSYFGKTFAPVSDVILKADGLGVSEMSKSYSHDKTQLYIEPSISFHFN